MSKNKIKEKRYQIIEPFLKGKKKLKEIENESGISYATLKRWVKSYKEAGVTGLKKKVRKDKNLPRNISNSTLEFLKRTYEGNPDIKITSLYNKCLTFIKDIKEENISYNTVYRIVNNLDTFVQSHAELHIKKLKKENRAYRMTHIQVDVEVKDQLSGNFIKPFLYIIYDVANLNILNYNISFEHFTLTDSLLFLRDTILKVQDYSDTSILVEDFIIDSFKLKKSNKLNEIKSLLGINVYSSFDKVSEIERFSNFLSEDLIKIIDYSKEILDLEAFDKLIFSYIYMTAKEYRNTCSITNDRSILEEGLDVFLESSKRNVQEYGIRFKNILYKNSKLKSIVGLQVLIKYDSLDKNYILVFIDNKYFCTAYAC